MAVVVASWLRAAMEVKVSVEMFGTVMLGIVRNLVTMSIDLRGPSSISGTNGHVTHPVPSGGNQARSAAPAWSPPILGG